MIQSARQSSMGRKQIMRVMEIRGGWGYDNLLPGERPEAPPGPREVLLRMRAASLNYRDYLMVDRGYGRRSGSLPLIPVSDGVGEVVEVGVEVTRVVVGDRVCPCFSQAWFTGPYSDAHWDSYLGGPLDGVMREFMTLSEEGVVKVPGHMSDLEASTLPVDALTAWSAVVDKGGAKAGDTVLVQGTGGVALFCLQIAKMIGAEVLITSSSDEKLQRCRAMGADHSANYREVQAWGEWVKDVTGGRGADLVIELGGAGTLDQSTRALAPEGTISLVGNLSGSIAEVNLFHVFVRAARLVGVATGNRQALEAMMRAFEVNPIRPVVDDRVYGFDELKAALLAVPEGRHFGNICLAF